VLRLNINDKFVLLNDENIGLFYILKLDKKIIYAKKIFHRKKIESKYKLIVYQSILKREYMDFVVEKLAELGVYEIIPVVTERSLQEINEKTLNRYRRLAIKGTLQSENENIMKIRYPLKIINLENIPNFYIFYERNVKKKLPKELPKNVNIFIGPEGGITREEIAILEKKGGKIISPINSILKAETAAVVFTGLIKCIMETA
jgi:16S rRNA (uracil1498-N3)-methyltransferase